MKKTSFFLGFVTGVILTFVGIMFFGVLNKSHEREPESPIKYFEQPVSYEDKAETSFKVTQVIGKAALAEEKSSDVYDLFLGNTVLILGENFYNGQIITMKEPQIIGTFSYTTKSDRSMTIPVLDARGKE